ncbi:MAG: ECF transporter S component [Clostridia bacterium]|nr:ECF transporter S component [Clostridia bacterium]
MKNSKVQWMIKVAMLSALSMILMIFEFPIPFIAPPFYELDFSEVPALLGSFALGPAAGIAIEVIKIVLNLVINSSITAGVGEFANLVIGISFVLPAGLIYQNKRTKKSAILGMTVGSFAMVVMGCFLNVYMLIPAYGAALKMPIEAFVEMGAAINASVDSLWKLVLLCTAPFNMLKAVLVSVITMLIYKPLSPVLKLKK